MPVSSSSFFHFINNGSTVLPLILENGFRTSISDEVIPYRKSDGRPSTVINGIPMVCFCDIPLAMIDSHAKFYCNDPKKIFGISMKRKWGVESNLNPVSYINGESHVHSVKFHEQKLMNQLYRYSLAKQPAELTLDHIQPAVVESRIYLPDNKVVNTFYPRGILYDKFNISDYYRFKGRPAGGVDDIFSFEDYYEYFEDHNFYNEREWRYVNKDIEVITSFQSVLMDNKSEADLLKEGIVFDRDYVNKCYQEYHDDKIKYHVAEFLKFDVNDIQTIIVADDDAATELMDVIEKLPSLGGNAIDDASRRILITKILTYEVIRDDFFIN